MKTILMQPLTRKFAENKDIAMTIRDNTLLPSLRDDETVELDFTGISCATQGFMHALLSDPIRQYPETVFDRILFKNCSDSVKEIITAVAEYMFLSIEA